MSLLMEMRRRARNAVLPVVSVAAMVYFGAHAVQGNNGILAWRGINQDIVRLRADLVVTSARRAELKHRVALMRPGALDRDMLGEQARRVLGYIHPDEILMFEDVDAKHN